MLQKLVQKAVWLQMHSGLHETPITVSYILAVCSVGKKLTEFEFLFSSISLNLHRVYKLVSFMSLCSSDFSGKSIVLARFIAFSE
jgi:hypothetical protein